MLVGNFDLLDLKIGSDDWKITSTALQSIKHHPCLDLLGHDASKKKKNLPKGGWFDGDFHPMGIPQSVKQKSPTKQTNPSLGSPPPQDAQSLQGQRQTF